MCLRRVALDSRKARIPTPTWVYFKDFLDSTTVPSPLFPSTSLPLEVGPLNPARGLGSAVSSPSEV